MENEIEEVRREYEKIVNDIKNIEAGGDIRMTEEAILKVIGRIFQMSIQMASSKSKIVK
jgi:hypothetical protein